MGRIRDFFKKIFNRKNDTKMLEKGQGVANADNVERNAKDGFREELRGQVEAKTMQLIPIDVIEACIADIEIANQVLSTLRYGELEFWCQKEDIVRAIYQYYQYLDSKGMNFSEKQIENISTLTGLDLPVKGQRTERVITVDFLRSILEDQETFRKFLDFDNNKEFFHGIPREEYLKELKEMCQTFQSKNIGQNCISEAHGYVMNTKDLEEFGKRVPETRVLDEEFKQSILSLIPEDADDYLKMYIIYDAVSTRLKYSNEFNLVANSDRFKNNDRKREIYDQDISEITNENNEVVCVTAAQVISLLLKEVGIDSVVTGKGKTEEENISSKLSMGHKYVVAQIGAELISLDNTNISMNNNDRTNLTDIARAKMGMEYGGIKSINLMQHVLDERLKTTRERTTQLLDKETMDLNDAVRSALKDKYDDRAADTISVDEKFDIIDSVMARAKNLDGIEALGVCKTLTSRVLTAEESKRVSVTKVAERGPDGKQECTLSFNLTSDSGEVKYYYLGSGRITSISLENLQKMFDEGSLVTLSEDKPIPGVVSRAHAREDDGGMAI